MNLPHRNWLIAGIAVAAFQTAAIGWMVWDRIQLLRTGREVVLPIVPVDPRSLFRGDYVILSYDAQNVPGQFVTDELKKARPAVFYVTWEKRGDAWQPAGITTEVLPPAADRLSVKARTRHGWWTTRPPRPVPPATVGAVAPASPVSQPEPVLLVRYGIESYFVAEGKGRGLEKTARERKLAAVIAVDARGNAAIKGLEIDGKRVYDEPLL